MNAYLSRRARWVWVLSAAAVITVAGVGFWMRRDSHGSAPVALASPTAAEKPADGSARSEPDVVELSPAQQEAIGLRVEPAIRGNATVVLEAPGQVVPDETRFVYLTPRSAGVVRSVAAHEGQVVKAGDLLAMIDSPDVAQARLDLSTRLQEQEVARSQAAWEETVYANTTALLEKLKAGESPDAIDRAFADRPLGSSREQLIRAYSTLRLARATFERSQELFRQQIIGPKQFDVARAESEAAQASFQSLMEQMAFDSRIARTRASQALRKADSAARDARARLRMLGASPDGSLPVIKDGKVQGVGPDGTLEANASAPPAASTASAASPGESHSSEMLISSYPLWAPFDGTVIDRMMIVPGVSVDLTSRLFTLADLSTVWVEVHLHENNYGLLARGRHAAITFTSPSYPGESFAAEVLYAGDVVDPKTRSLRLMARAKNPDRRLKPGMFVEVTVRIPEARPAVVVPASALLSEGAGKVVFVERGPGRFAYRRVVVGSDHGDGNVEVLEGLEPGERVATHGAFKLKAERTLHHQAGSSSSDAGLGGEAIAVVDPDQGGPR